MQLARGANRGHSEEQRVAILLKIHTVTREKFSQNNILNYYFFNNKNKHLPT